MLTKRRVIAAAYQANDYTSVDPSSSVGGIVPLEPKIEVDIKMHQRNVAMGALGALASIPGARSAKITFKVEMKGSGVIYTTTAPAIGKFLVACGFKEVIAGDGSTATYTPISTVTYASPYQATPITIWCYEDGVVKKISCTKGTVKFTGKIGEPIYAEFSFMGVWDGVSTTTFPTATYEASTPPVIQLDGTTNVFNIGSTKMGCQSFEIDMNNTLYLRESITSGSGYISTIITNRRPNGKVDPELTSTYIPYTPWQNGTTASLTIGAVGSSQYNKFTITAPSLLYEKIADTDRGGMAIADASFQLAMVNGDDEISIVFS